MASRLEAHTEELHSVAASLAAAARTLAALPALSHPPIAQDEVSASAATRFTVHGAVLQSRATDGSAVLASAAQALIEAVRAYTEMDRANASAVSLAGNPGFAGPAMMPAVTVDMVAPVVPISPPAPRDGEQVAAMLEAGNPDAGAEFAAGCRAYSASFRDSARSARSGAATVSGALQGEAGPRIVAALGRFADWADAMGEHADTVAGLVSGHKVRFLTARHDTPSTHDFRTTRQELATADELNRRYKGAYTPAVVKLQTDLAGLHTRAGMASETRYVGELPAAPPPPPPVVSVVSGDVVPAPGPGAAHGQTGQGSDHPAAQAHADASLDDGGPVTAAASAQGDGLPADPALAGQAGQALPAMAASLPSMLAGALGGVVGMAASVPAQIAQQAQGLASEAVRAVSGLASGMGKPDVRDMAGDHPVLGDVGGLGGADGLGGDTGGGGGVTDPGAGSPVLPSEGGMLAAGEPPTPTPLVGQAPTAAGAPGAAAGPGAMPMMMPGMGGMGAGSGGGARPAAEPDKTIHMPADPNAAVVKGDVARRPTAVTDDPTAKPKQAAQVTVTSSDGRRIVVPKDERGE